MCVQEYIDSRRTMGALSFMDTYGVLVLKSSFWPPLHMFADTILPPSMDACARHFKAYYEAHQPSRTVRSPAPYSPSCTVLLVLCPLVCRVPLCVVFPPMSYSLLSRIPSLPIDVPSCVVCLQLLTLIAVLSRVQLLTS